MSSQPNPERLVYLDHSATTPVRPEVLAAMLPYFANKFGNASSVHRWGYEARQAINDAREKVASLIEASPNEILFTSGGTESDNLAIRGVAHSRKAKGKHLITSQIEHHAVLHTFEALQKEGFEVTFVPCDKYGLIDPDDIKRAIRKDTILISIMHGQNEVGTIEPIKDIGAIAREHGVLFHTDAVQSAGKVPIDVRDMNIDLLTVSSHKIYGPKGVGALYVRKGVRLVPQITGGAHERRMRAGTENVPGIVGFGEACRLAKADLPEESQRLANLRDKLIQGILDKIPDVVLNGHPTLRLPHNVNVSVKYLEGESILLNLDRMGVAASSGSACTSGSLEPSHVLLAMGLSHETAHGSLRFTLGRSNTEEDIDYVLEVLPPIVEKLRSMSPLGPGSGL
ncbi:MAG: cysteine desulfurase NifS [Bacillota bacterium]|jgi:cysteine desulfurase|nr:cysteine desulfurase NifS [Candidatus Fermentithermobacillaceae bacterium]HOA70340.1 cysteine desulfurase NifS [Bacillota bacterium]HOP70069.1 cysteine desulfurase NifS [Bacillota bacterium]HPT35412.1 cysteine desulfurase NifS [Bacillota bacterium]HQD85382.1 cysteine desulfurase NifS [Bacillota bacterium]